MRALSTPFLVAGGIVAVGALAFSISLQIRNRAVEALVRVEREDPLFDFPGLTPEDALAVAAIVETANAEMLAFYPPLRHHRIYPYEFWGVVAQLAVARAEFLAQPSWWRGFRLLRVEQLAAGAYAAELGRLVAFFEATLKDDATQHQETVIFSFFPGVFTDVATMRDSFSQLKENSTALRGDIRSRSTCLFFGSCRTLARQEHGARSSLERVALGTAPSPAPGPLLPAEHLNQVGQLLRAEALDERPFALRTECFGRRLTPAPFFLWQLSDTFYPKLADNSFFRTLSGDDVLPHYKLIYRAGFRFAWQPEANWYMCPDLRYYPVLATMRRLMELIDEQPLAELLRPLISTSAYLKLRDIESELSQAQTVDSAALDAYAETLREAMGHVAASQNPELTANVHQRIRLWATKSGDLFRVMQNLKRETARYGELVRRAGRPPRFMALMLSRSYASLLYAPWNDSVWRLSVEPRFLVAREPAGVMPVEDYWSLREAIGSENIQSIIELSVQGWDS